MRNAKFLVDASSKFFKKNNISFPFLICICQELIEGNLDFFELPYKYRTIISVFLFSLVEYQLRNGDLDDEEAE